MQTLLLITALTTGIVHGEEAGGATMREKLHAKIVASVQPPTAKPAGDRKKAQPTVAPPVVMTPLVVSGSKVIREVAAAMAREEEYRLAERFSPLSGGTIYSSDRLQLGSWWSPAEGWTFLRLNKRPGQHQVEDTAARIKDLEELARIGEKPKPAPR